MAADEDNPVRAAKDVNAELRALELEETKLRVEDLKVRVQAQRDRQAEDVRRAEIQRRSIDDANRNIKANQDACKHRKGGKNLAGIMNGNDSNYSVNQHTYPWGETVVFCTRCSREWRMPSVQVLKAANPKWTSAQVMEEYRRQEAEYKTALGWPTDNEPSGTQLFTITPAAPAPEKEAV